MGTPCCCMTFDQWISIIGLFLSLLGIIVSALIAVWVVKVIQNRLTDTRVIKDYFIDEIRDIRNQYRSFINELMKGAVETRTIVSTCKLLNIRTSDLMQSACSKFKLEEKAFSDYHYDLLSFITDCDSVITSYKNDEKAVLTQVEKVELISIQQKYAHLFNDVILRINDQE